MGGKKSDNMFKEVETFGTIISLDSQSDHANYARLECIDVTEGKFRKGEARGL